MNKKIHFVGIGGISMSALAEFCHRQGWIVTGSDMTENRQTQRLQNLGIKVSRHDACNITKDICLCVKTAAIPQQNEELCRCKELGVKVVDRAQVLGKIFDDFKYGIAVAGSHGKTTTTALIYEILSIGGVSPTMFLGGEYGENGNLRVGKGEVCLVEACEYERSFLQLKPFVSVVLNAEYEHADCYADEKEVLDAFGSFVENTAENGVAVVNFELKDKIKTLSPRTITFGKNPSADFCAKNLIVNDGKYSFDVVSQNVNLGKISLELTGEHNVLNALAAYAVAKQFGLDHQQIAAGAKKFCGVKRRFERYESDFTTVIADYAHHPTEIVALIDAAKQLKHKNIFILFQPHTYSRTKNLMADFEKCFIGAKQVAVLPVYAAREKYDKSGDSKTLVGNIKKFAESIFVENFEKAAKWAQENICADDLLLVVGAGDVIDFCRPCFLNKYKQKN